MPLFRIPIGKNLTSKPCGKECQTIIFNFCFIRELWPTSRVVNVGAVDKFFSSRSLSIILLT